MKQQGLSCYMPRNARGPNSVIATPYLAKCLYRKCLVAILIQSMYNFNLFPEDVGFITDLFKIRENNPIKMIQ